MAERTTLNLDQYRERLQAMAEQTQHDLDEYHQRVTDMNGGPDEPGPGQHWEHSGYGDHLADEATEVFEREKALGLQQSLEVHLEEIKHALSRIEAGSYGMCERCGQPIAKERLDAMPEAVLCIQCKTQEEQHVRPAERRQPGALI